MHLSSPKIRALSEVMRLLADANDGDRLREALALPMLDLLGADTYVSMVWNGETRRFERVKALNISLENLRSWDEYFRFIDPLTVPMMERRRPTVATQILRQHELSRTEFFNDFLLRDRMYWGVNVYFHDGQEYVGDFRIWRTRERGNFDPSEVEALRLVEPAITAALTRLRAQGAVPSPLETEHAESLLQRVGRLSQREAQVAWLVSSGCGDKMIASRMNVGHTTVRFHLANVFRKLQTENRAALASRVQLLLGLHDGQRSS